MPPVRYVSTYGDRLDHDEEGAADPSRPVRFAVGPLPITENTVVRTRTENLSTLPASFTIMS
jgi:hypothetical protein